MFPATAGRCGEGTRSERRPLRARMGACSAACQHARERSDSDDEVEEADS